MSHDACDVCYVPLKVCEHTSDVRASLLTCLSCQSPRTFSMYVSREIYAQRLDSLVLAGGPRDGCDRCIENVYLSSLEIQAYRNLGLIECN